MEVENTKQPDYLRKIDELREEMINDLQSLIRQKSVQDKPLADAPFGEGVREAFHHFLQLGAREGFECVNVDEYGGHMDYGNSEEHGIMGILCHLDVVPAGNEADWKHGPFSGDIEDGIMYGRGTLDDKGPTISAFYAMKALHDCGYEPYKKIRMIIGLDEETNSEGMEYYKNKTSMPDLAIVPDSDFPLVHGEMGIMMFDLAKKFRKAEKKGTALRKITGGTAANMVAESAAATILSTDGYKAVKSKLEEFNESTGYNLELRNRGKSIEISSHGLSAHGAMPWKGKNAISMLLEFLGHIEFNSPDVNEFIEFYNEHIAFDFHGESLGCDLSDDISGKLILNVGKIELNGEAVNLTINVRCPISKNDEDVYQAMMPVLEKYEIGVVKNMYKPPLYFPEENPTVQLLLKIYQKHTGDMESKPLVIGGGTYAREMDNAIAYGALYPGDMDTMHQTNESVRLDRVVQTAKIYAEAIYELAVKDPQTGDD